jgi:hypothetical protein
MRFLSDAASITANGRQDISDTRQLLTQYRESLPLILKVFELRILRENRDFRDGVEELASLY